jgi:hypothetical protein
MSVSVIMLIGFGIMVLVLERRQGETGTLLSAPTTTIFDSRLNILWTQMRREATRTTFRPGGTCSQVKVTWATFWRVKSDGEFASWGLTLRHCRRSGLGTDQVGEHSSWATRFRFRQPHPCTSLPNWLPEMGRIIRCGVRPVAAEVRPKCRGTSGQSMPCHRL